ncbi:MAG: hypothetical protein HYS53_00795 [Candidatus Aenigmarchaeota archaeon]|nr:hypothetical protein [Candidatus Aenigmarchaeota archaeon]
MAVNRVYSGQECVHESFLERPVTRRNFLGGLLRGAGVLALSGSIGQVLDACIGEKPDYTLADVKAGIVSPKAYVKEVSSSIPEIQSMKKSGVLKDVLYDPFEQDLRQLLTGLFSTNNVDAGLLEAQMDVYREAASSDRGIATVAPGMRQLFGKNVPVYMIFRPGFVDELETDEEFRLTALHELVHAEDIYNGVRVGKFHIRGIQPGIADEFVRNLAELRATHRVSALVYQGYKATGKLPVTARYFLGELRNYSKHWEFLKNNTATTVEKEIAEAQLAEFSDMVPTALKGEGNPVRIDFRFGGEDSFVIKDR